MNYAERQILKNCYVHRIEFPEVTEHDITRYCDYTVGNDYSGDGGVSNPYKTPIRAMQDVAHRIAHKVKIVLGGPGAYAVGSFPEKIDNVIEGAGSLTFYGVGAPMRKAVNGGPHAVTGVALVEDAAQRVTCGAAAWNVDEFKGYWVRVVTGGHVGRTFCVYANTATTVDVYQDFTGDRVENGDTIEIISPMIVVAIEKLDICPSISNREAIFSLGGKTPVVISNLKLDASASTSTIQLKVRGDCLFDFVGVVLKASGGYVENCAWSYYAPTDNSYVAGSGAGIANMAEEMNTPGASLTSAGGSADTLIYASGDFVIHSISMTGQLSISAAGYAQFFGSCAAANQWAGSGGSFYAYLSGVNAATAALLLNDCRQLVKIVAMGACSYAVDIASGAEVRIEIGDGQCDAVLCDKGAVRFGDMCKVRVSGAGTNFLGKTAGQEAYIAAMAAGTKAATWPVAGTYVTDAKGGELLRVA